MATKVKIHSVAETTREIRGLTMACWWPSRITGKRTPDWEGITGELDALIKGAKARLEYDTATPQEVHHLVELRHWADGQ